MQQGIRFENLLALDGAKRNRLCDRVHQMRRVESLEARERSLRIVDRPAEPAYEAREQLEQLCAPTREQLELAGRARQLVFEKRDARAAIQAIAAARELRQDAKARFTDEQDVERSVRALLGVGDAAEPTLYVRDNAPMSAFPQPGGAILSSLAPTASTGQ